MKFGAIYQSFDPPEVFLEYVRAVEDGGFDYLWVCDSSLHARDVFAYLTLAATHTTRIRLGVSVFQPYTRHPAVNVNGMSTINEISGGRAIMAVGAGDRPQLELGFTPAPVQLVREMIQVSKRLIAGESVSFANEQFQLRDARLRCNPNLSLPVYVACSGPKMLEMAGELADGVIMLSGGTRDTLEFGLTHLRRGLERGHRSQPDLDVAWGAATVIADDRQHALDQTRVMAAWYANHSPAYAQRTGAPAELIDTMRTKDPGRNLHEARAASAIAPDDMVDRLTLAGPPAHVIERIGIAQDLGINHFELFLIGPEKMQTLQRFVAEVMPAFANHRLS
jgi:5,10-methylenetetrahydromethanopterin reductase